MGLAKSMIRFPWALSVFGVQQVANLLVPRNRNQPDRKTEASFYAEAA